MNRRRLLATTGILALLAACSTGAPTLTQLQTDAALVTAGAAAVAVSVEATPNLDPAVRAKIDSAMATVNAANGVIQQSTQTPGTAAQQFVVAVRVAAPLLLATLNPSSPEAIAVNAALALLPTILTAAGVPAAPVPAARLGMGAEEAAEARLVIHGYIHK